VVQRGTTGSSAVDRVQQNAAEHSSSSSSIHHAIKSVSSVGGQTEFFHQSQMTRMNIFWNRIHPDNRAALMLLPILDMPVDEKIGNGIEEEGSGRIRLCSP
jgi:hypothetical protein